MSRSAVPLDREPDNPAYDVLIVGAGNAGLCAALSAREHANRVLVLECAPMEKRGGNSYFTGGLVRFPFSGIDDIRELIGDLTESELASIEVGQYTEEQFFDDIARVTEYRTDADLASLLVRDSLEAMKWMAEKGIRFALAMGRQAFKSGQKFRFWGSAPVEYLGGGVGLMNRLFEVSTTKGIEIWYEARAIALVTDSTGAVTGVVVRKPDGITTVLARAVVLAAGGFEANPEMRARYLGPDWDLAKVRGTEYNTGDAIKMALDIGAQPYGHWSGCHAVAWDLNAPAVGDRVVGESYQKHSYPFGIVVNRNGKRFIDEGADFRNYTYAKYGKEILKQPGMVAYQIFDSKVVHLLRDEYRIREVTKFTASSLDDLARGLEIDVSAFSNTVRDFNAAVMDVPFEPTIKDGKGTRGIAPPKSNWALAIDAPPYVGFAVTCGITFTFGGLRIDLDAAVLDIDSRPIPGLFAAGELIGGLFYHNYPGGTGLSSGSVFGRIAGRSAAMRGAGTPMASA